MTVNITAFTTITVLLPMLYLLLASPAFLFVRLDIPQVAYLLRSMFFGYYLALVTLGLLAVGLNAAKGNLFQSLGFAALTGFGLALRHWMMRQFDTHLAEVESGHNGAAPRLRRLHLLGMAANALLLITIIAFIPLLAITT